MKFNIISKKLSLFVSVLLCTCILTAQEAVPEAADELQKNFVIVENLHNYNLDPHTANYSAEAQILTGLYEGLFSYDPITLDPTYAMAKNYRISRDKKRWTFELKDNLKFSDGVALTADDVRSSWLKLLENPNAPYASLFDIVKGAREYRTGTESSENVGIYVIDDKTISLHLNTPAAHLPKLLCMAAFAIKSNDENIFSGPFVLAERTPLYMVLKRNENYYDAEHVQLEQITILLSNDESDNVFAYNTGSVDWLASSFDEKKLLSQDAIHLTAEFATQYFFFKQNEGSVWNNVKLRQALLEAVPYDELRANTYVQASTLVYPLNGYQKAEGYVFTDKLEAELLMEEARKELSISADQRLELKIAIPDTEYMNKKAKLFKDCWEPLGVDVKTITFPEFEYLYNVEETEADLFTYTWIGDFADPLAFLELFRGNSTMNVSNWADEKYDSLLDEASLYTDENHNKLLNQAEQILLDEAVVIPVQHPVSVNIINLNAVGGWAINAFDIHPLKYLFKRETKDVIPNIVMLTE